MNTEACIRGIIYLALAWIFTFAWAPTAFAQEDAKYVDPVIKMMREARRAGDIETLSALQGDREKSPRGGESAGGAVVRKSATISGPGDLSHASGKPQKGDATGSLKSWFGIDVHVRSGNGTSREANQDMVCDSGGNLYVVWQDDLYNYDYLQVYYSAVGGKEWKPFGYIMNASAHLKNPSIAVGTGSQSALLIAYIVDDGSSVPYPEVVVAPLSTMTFTIRSVPYYSHWEGFDKPVIWTDAWDYKSWGAYLTCEGIFDSVANNINVCTWRSKDFGATWLGPNTVLGNSDTDAWIDPDGSYGTTMDRVFVSCYNATNKCLYTLNSDDFAASFNPEIMIHPIPVEPAKPVDPEIAAAINYDNVMLCFSWHNVYDNIGYTCSQDGGESWTGINNMNGGTEKPEFGVELHANEGGASWHLAFTREHHVYYTHRPQDLSFFWDGALKVVDDHGTASHEYIKKGIASNWSTNVVSVAWADNRDGGSDYDTYVDFIENIGLSTYLHYLDQDTGGTRYLYLNAGAGNKNRDYLILGSITGTLPGIPLPGGQVTLPINWDLFTNIVISLVNTPTFENFMGTLDNYGRATAKLVIGPVPGAAGIIMNYAFALNKKWDFVSNPLPIEIVP